MYVLNVLNCVAKCVKCIKLLMYKLWTNIILLEHSFLKNSVAFFYKSDLSFVIWKWAGYIAYKKMQSIQSIQKKLEIIVQYVKDYAFHLP